MSASLQHRRMILIGELLAVLFMEAVAAAAHGTGVNLLLFPELAALSHDVLTRPEGKWASQPFRFILTPTLAAVAGLFITRHAPYNPIAILAIVSAGLLTIRLLRSSIAPAISAGVLPMLLDERHWTYPLAIGAGLVGLALLLWVWRRCASSVAASRDLLNEKIDDALEMRPAEHFWPITLLAFVWVVAVISQLTGLRFILFPPLIVMACEILGHPEVPGWMEHPALFPLVSSLTACVGLVACRDCNSRPAGVVLAVAISILLLRLFRMHMPPALAIGVLPFVISGPNIWYPISVVIGTTALTFWFLAQGHLRDTRIKQTTTWM